jgi:2-keto-3-deoxy-L-rhamnonate aldolase RhmA
MMDLFSMAGLDFVVIDMEHGPIDFTRASEMVLSCKERCAPLVRVPKNKEEYIQQALDMGAEGVIIPHVRTVEHRKKAVSFMKYMPKGERGYSPYTKGGGYRPRVTTMEEQNEKATCILLIEHEEGVRDIEEIVADDNVDGVYIGVYDLSVSMGIPGEVSGERMKKVITDVAKKMKKSGKFIALMVHTPEEYHTYRDLGAQMIFYKVDCAIVADAIQSFKSNCEARK